ncbi:MAG: flagellar motor switch protein FliM [Clostridiales bacterium GWF2_36_10]|nr:MAG: flagellar motor switch protein FliM [Clostridiales bacterium GWF2_36_10]HAN20851.1 flagellar motor switch protein FliM [Clostridiales bacterium]
MAEILSQSQIDDLLNELAGVKIDKVSSDLEDHSIKNYDFKSPKKMSREQNKALSSLTDVIGRHLAAYFAGVLRNYCEINVDSIDEHPYYEYNNSLPDVLMTAVVDIDSINGSILLDMSNSITYTLIERMLGGSVDTTIIPNREFTEIEVALMERVFKKMCMFIQEALVNLPNTNVTLRNIETSTRFIKAIRIEEVVEVIVYSVTIGSIKGTITACIPYTYVEAMIMSVVKNEDKLNNNITTDEVRNAMLEELSNSLVDVCGIIGTAKLSLKDLMNLQSGDVIKLEQKVGNPVLVTINNNKWFWGEPGVKKSSKAIRFSKYYKGGF